MDGSDAIVVAEATARRLWPDREPIGQLLLGGPGDRLATVVSSLSSSLSALALVLSSVGIYGVVAYAVGRRAR